jgi:hypothetical protein
MLQVGLIHTHFGYQVAEFLCFSSPIEHIPEAALLLLLITAQFPSSSMRIDHRLHLNFVRVQC